MAKTRSKKGGKRLTRAQMIEKLETFFSSNPNETFTLKQIFKLLHLDTHPLKMLAIDIMEEMAWDDYLIKISDTRFTDGRTPSGSSARVTSTLPLRLTSSAKLA